MSRPSGHTLDGPRILAWFEDYDQVRSAEVELERHGIDPVNVSIARPDATADRRRIDRRSFGWIGQRAAVGAVIGALAGALVGALVGALLNGWTTDVWFFVIGGAIFGVAPGFFYSVGTRLPAAPEAFDTFGDDDGRRVCLAVTGDERVRHEAAAVLRGLGATRVEERS
jgi:hypothetical protein